MDFFTDNNERLPGRSMTGWKRAIGIVGRLVLILE